MDMERTNKKYIIIIALTFLLAAFSPFTCFAEESTENKDNLSVIHAIKIKQVGDNQLIITLRGEKLTAPAWDNSTSNAFSLKLKNTRYADKTDQQEWWNELEWDFIRPDDNGMWSRTYERSLVHRVITRKDSDTVNIDIYGKHRMRIKEFTPVDNTEFIHIVLEAENNIKPYLKPKKTALPKNDPMSITTPVTLELRGIQLSELLMMFADLQKLNMILDPSVPDNSMTVSFKGTKFADAFSYILKMNGLSYGFADNTLIVGTDESISKTLDTETVREYRIAYADVDKLPQMVTWLVTLNKAPVVDKRRRSLFISATAEQHVKIETFINKVDHPSKQIMLEARLIEMNEGAKKDIETIINSVYKGWLFTYGSSGMTGEFTDSNGLLKPNVLTGKNTSTSSTNSNNGNSIPSPGQQENGQPVHIVDHLMKALDVGLRAMESENLGKVLASPSVVALDGKQAKIKLTHNVVYQSGVDSSRNPTYSEQETGPVLEIMPQVGRDGFVTLGLKIMTGDIIDFKQSSTQSVVPETTKREVNTEIRVRSGEMFVIGGLYQENDTKQKVGVPVVSNIPLLGNLFKSVYKNHTKSEMAFIVVPYILDIPTGNAEVYSLYED